MASVKSARANTAKATKLSGRKPAPANETRTGKPARARTPKATKSGGRKSAAVNDGTVFLIHGRNLQAKQEVCLFLEALGLKPVDFGKERELARSAPTVLEIVQQGMERCQLVLALFTPDEWSVLGGDMRKDGEDEREHCRWQARPNVMFEAGLAYSKDPERVVFLELGDVKLFSDVTGMHSFAPTNRHEKGSPRHSLYNWLKNWFKDRGIEIRNDGAWKLQGDFEACVAPRARHLDAYSAPSAGWPWLERQAIDDLLGSVNRSRDIIGDSIQLTPWTSERFRVRVEDPACSADFQGPFSGETHADLLDLWLQTYPPAVRALIEPNIGLASTGAIEQAKLGFVSYDGATAALDEDSLSITLRPINHLVTTAFNRGLASERLKYKSYGGEIHRLWVDQLRQILAGQLQSFHFQCPSQVFLEVALITSDGFVPITQKHDINSVYARRNGKRMVWTCGFEVGPRWADVASPDEVDPHIAELDFHGVARRGLEKEFAITLGAEDAEHLKIRSLALQTLHLNTAFLGYWVLPYTRREMLERCKGKRLGGLDHSRLYFTRFQDSDKHLAHEESTAWHGTAMARFKLLEESESEISNELNMRFGAGRP